MKYNPTKDLATGAMILGGTILVAVAADTSIPILAIVGAGIAVGGGVYRVATLPARNGKKPPSLPKPGNSGGDSATS
jgi:hypothetical protein